MTKISVFGNKSKNIRRSTTGILVLLLYILPIHSHGQIITVGSGSYSTSLPAGAVGPQNFAGANLIPKVSTTFDQPIQTNDFWSSLIYPFFGDPHSNNIFAHPLNFKAANNGLQIGYTSSHIFAASDYLYPFSKQLTVGVIGLSASQTVTHHYGDWTVTALWQDGARSMEATFGHGLPYVFFKITGGNAVLTSEQTPTIWFNQDEVLGITIDGKHYGIFAPTGSAWSGTNTFQSSLNGKNYFLLLCCRIQLRRHLNYSEAVLMLLLRIVKLIGFIMNQLQT
jgi:endoglucanase Acf2